MAGGATRIELDRAGALEVPEPVAAVHDQPRSRARGCDAVDGHHHRLHGLAELVVGHADHRHVGDGGMARQHVFASCG